MTMRLWKLDAHDSITLVFAKTRANAERLAGLESIHSECREVTFSDNHEFVVMVNDKR